MGHAWYERDVADAPGLEGTPRLMRRQTQEVSRLPDECADEVWKKIDVIVEMMSVDRRQGCFVGSATIAHGWAIL